MQNKEIELMQKKAKFFFDRNKAVHIKFKKGHFYNGIIEDINSADFFILREFVSGTNPVFYLEIENIVEFTTEVEKEKVEKNGRRS